ncbi:hypothetical protein BTJ40_19835 [Microbulbifer sp. A4B17]|uniref:hypothetical protein n=1 Tax=Microbulbifer sp. A4B17 TaxID=359370 RepID=UPI000D52CF4B|nr:hypothetical protein [Microbulbifer sp. A4B17]AWF82888.1 hypothetical protein BTJ40_19835 [Microbulbifer sp. A4B17]
MNYRNFFIGTMVLFANASFAEQISVPNEFFSGSRALAAEVNENFTALVDESNAQDIRIENSEALILDIVSESNSQDERIAALEGAASKEQLICKSWHTYWYSGNGSIECISSSSSSTISFSLVQDIYAAGWQAKSVGGSDNIIIIFEK